MSNSETPIDAITRLDAAASELHGMWKEYKILYCNGVIVGNEGLLDAVDLWESLDTKAAPQRDIMDARGNLMYQLLKQMNDITDEEARKIATQKNLEEVIEVWSEL